MTVFDELFDAAMHADDIFHTDREEFRTHEDEVLALRYALDRLMGTSFDTIRRMRSIGLLAPLKNAGPWT